MSSSVLYKVKNCLVSVCLDDTGRKKMLTFLITVLVIHYSVHDFTMIDRIVASGIAFFFQNSFHKGYYPTQIINQKYENKNT